MLITDKRDELTGMSQLLEPGVCAWKAVTLEHREPYFLVSFSIKEGSARLRQTSLLGNEYDLANFCAVAANSPDHDIDDIAQLSRQAQGKNRYWRVLQVCEVWTGTDHEFKYPMIRLIGDDGKIIPSFPKPRKAAEKFTKLFP
ncbi:MAG: hypothetical protein EOO88_39815 [Pedobacter sp.]|nr:MAG: hypothetical protein EOO88_39815 [Pedobacter sp.]